MGFRYFFDALLGLFRLGLATRFRLGAPYWAWRVETAFGTDRSQRPSIYRRLRLVLDYAAWTSRMRRLR